MRSWAQLIILEPSCSSPLLITKPPILQGQAPETILSRSGCAVTICAFILSRYTRTLELCSHPGLLLTYLEKWNSGSFSACPSFLHNGKNKTQHRESHWNFTRQQKAQNIFFLHLLLHNQRCHHYKVTWQELVWAFSKPKTGEEKQSMLLQYTFRIYLSSNCQNICSASSARYLQGHLLHFHMRNV